MSSHGGGERNVSVLSCTEKASWPSGKLTGVASLPPRSGERKGGLQVASHSPSGQLPSLPDGQLARSTVIFQAHRFGEQHANRNGWPWAHGREHDAPLAATRA